MQFKQFAGLRNTVSAERFEPGDLELAVNVDLDESGKLKLRAGYALALSAAGAHSLWSDGLIALYVQSTSLKRLSESYSATTLRSGLTSGARMAYAKAIDRIYFSNGHETGVVDQGVVRTWGIELPEHVGVAAQAAGLLPAGIYQWTLTYLREDGQESGAMITGRIELDDNSAIALSSLPVSDDPGVVGKILYLTPTNGDEFYEAMVLDDSDTSATYRNDGRELVRPLETLYQQQAPAGQCVAYFRGHLLVARGTTLYRSKPYGYELFDLREYHDFDATITMIAPVDDGVFIGTELATYFLPGAAPSDWVLVRKADYGVIPGSETFVNGADIGEGVDGPAVLWLAQEGVCVGSNGGGFQNLTHDRMNLDISAELGASVVINRRLISTTQ